MFCGHLWSLFSIFKSCIRSMACEHPKSFMSKTLSPNSEQVQTLTLKSNMKSNTFKYSIISILRTESPVKEIPFSVVFGKFQFHLHATRHWLFSSAFFNFSALRHQKADLWAHLESNVGTKSKEFMLVFFVHGNWCNYNKILVSNKDGDGSKRTN